MKTKLVIAVVLVIIAIIVITVSGVCSQMQNVIAKETAFQAGYDHGCADSKLNLSERYIYQPYKGPQFHTREFMTGYNTGFNICSSGHGHSSPIFVSSIGNANNSSNSTTNSSSFSFKQGYAKAISDAKLEEDKFPASTVIRPDEVDCDSDIDSHMSDEEYCLGYQHGFADTINHR